MSFKEKRKFIWNIVKIDIRLFHHLLVLTTERVVNKNELKIEGCNKWKSEWTWFVQPAMNMVILFDENVQTSEQHSITNDTKCSGEDIAPFLIGDCFELMEQIERTRMRMRTRMRAC